MGFPDILLVPEHPGPVIFLEHKLLADCWLEYMGSGGRQTVTFDVPAQGAVGEVPQSWKATPLGKAALLRTGD